MSNLRQNFKNQEGQSMVLIALLLVGLVAFLGLVFDVGNAYAQRRFMQNAADAGSLAGARTLAGCQTQNADCEQAVKNAITTYANSNNSPSNLVMRFVDSSGTVVGQPIGSNNGIPANTAGVKVTPSKTFVTMFLGLIGAANGSVAATASAAYGAVDMGGQKVMPMARKCGDPLGAKDQCGLQIGTTYDIWQGGGSGNFGWLSWSGSNDAGYIEAELNPDHIVDYVDPHATCSALKASCWVQGLTGVTNSSGDRAQMDAWVARGEQDPPVPMIITIYDTSEASGSGTNYHIIGFAAFVLQSYDLPGKHAIGKFVEWVIAAPICRTCKVTGLSGVQLIN